MAVIVTTRMGHLNDPRITKMADGRWRVDSLDREFKIKLDALEALLDADRGRDCNCDACRQNFRRSEIIDAGDFTLCEACYDHACTLKEPGAGADD